MPTNRAYCYPLLLTLNPNTMENRNNIPKTRKQKPLTRRQKKLQQSDGLKTERRIYKETLVRSYSHRIEEVGKVYGGYVAYNSTNEEYVGRQSNYSNESGCEVRKAGPQPLRHFGL